MRRRTCRTVRGGGLPRAGGGSRGRAGGGAGAGGEQGAPRGAGGGGGGGAGRSSGGGGGEQGGVCTTVNQGYKSGVPYLNSSHCQTLLFLVTYIPASDGDLDTVTFQ